MKTQKLNPAPQRQTIETVKFKWIDWGTDANDTHVIRIFLKNDVVIMTPLSTFTGPRRVLFKIFGDAGHLVTKMEQLEPLLTEVHRAINNDAKSFVCSPLGWNKKLAAYIGPAKIYGEPPPGIEIIRTFGDVNQLKFAAQGSKEQWDEIAKLSRPNSRYVFVIGCALAGPVLDILGLPSSAFQLFGPPGIGKTILLKVAGSVWGGDVTAPHRSFREILPSSITELQQLVLAHKDGFLPLDETPTLATGKRLNELIDRMVIRLPEAVAPVSLLIATSTALPDRLGAMFDDSYRSRLPSIPADAGKGLGTFEELHGHRNAAALARHLEALTSKCFGTAIDGFLERLVQDRLHHPTELLNFLRRRCEDYCQTQGRNSANPVDGWITEKFGYIYAVSVLAIRYGILPWTIEHVRWAVAECERGHHEAMANTTVDIDPVTIVREYLIENNDRLVKVPNSQMTREQFETAPAVWYINRDNNIIFGIRPPIFRQLFNKVEITNVLKTLHGERYLVSDNSGGERDRWETKMPIFGPRDSDRARMYCIRGDIYPEFTKTKVKADREPGSGAAAPDSSAPDVTKGGGPGAASAAAENAKKADQPPDAPARILGRDAVGAAVTVPTTADIAKDGGRPSDGDTGNLDTTNAGGTPGGDADPPDGGDAADGPMDAPEMARVTGDGGRPPDGDPQRPSGPEPATASDAARVTGGGADQPDGAENDTTSGRTSTDAARVPGDGDPRPDREIRTPDPEKPAVAPSQAPVPGSGAEQPDAAPEMSRPSPASGPPPAPTAPVDRTSSRRQNPYSRPGRWRDYDIE